jgi:hypothetical protein
MTRPTVPTITAALVLGTLALLLAGMGSVAAGGQPELWQPPPEARWQYQLESANRGLAPSGGINVEICEAPHGGGACVRPAVFDIDLYVDARVSGNNRTINAAGVEAIHDRGGHAICYVSAGTAERFRPDYGRYVRFDRHHGQSLLGKPFSNAFPNERWLNLKNGRDQRDFILRRVESRTAKCARAGFDGVEYDNVDAYAQGRKVTGWQIRATYAARLQSGAGQDRAPQRPLRGAQERPRATRAPRAPLRLRDQRAVLLLPRVRHQPPARLPGLHAGGEGRVSGGVPNPPRPVLRQGGRPRDQLDQEGGRLLAQRPALEALPVATGQGTSLPGFMIPAGSSRSLTARRASIPSSPTSAAM